jgi:transketolase C-terminal domain/subunit
VLAPCDAEELAAMLRWTLTRSGPCVIRYAKSGTPVQGREGIPDIFTAGKWNRLREGENLTLLAAGSMVRRALKTAELLREKGLNAEVWNCSTVKPLDSDVLSQLKHGTAVFTLEEHMLTGGFGEYVTAECRKQGWQEPAECIAVPDRFIAHGEHEKLMKEAGLTPEQICGRILARLKGSAFHE